MSELHRTEDALRGALRTIREHWAALLEETSGGMGGIAGSDTVTGLDRRVSLRHEVTLCLNGWARVIVEDRDLSHDLPLGHDTIGLVDLVERHVQWFSGHEAAQDALAEIEDWAEQVKRTAAPPRRDWLPIGDCPCTIADEDGNSVTCGGQVRAYPDKNFIACPNCGHDDTLAWWMSQILPEGSDVGTADAVIAFVVSRTFRPLTHEQLRQWASRGFVARHGRDIKGRTLYSSKAVLAYAQSGTREDVAA